MRYFIIFLITINFLKAQSQQKSSLELEYILQGWEANKFISGAEIVRMYTYTSIPAFVKFKGNSGIAEESHLVWVMKMAKLGSNGGLKLIRKENDDLGFTHYRYTQTYRGFEIFGSAYIVHCKNGFVTSVNGQLYNNVSTNETKISEKKGLELALKHVNAKSYKWEIPEEEELARHEFEHEKIRKSPTYYPKGELKIVPKNGDFYSENHSFRLCYVYDIYSHEPMDRKEIFINAENGEVDFQNPLILHGNSNGTANTAYSGTRSIITDSVTADSFRLREIGRGNGIQTFNLKKGTNYAVAVDFRDSNNIWNNINANKDQYATDAHWGSEMTYDYFWQKHSRNSIDDAGFLLKSYIHYSTNYTNAFWDGTRMTYGDGASPYTPLVAMDIAGHEIAHGLTEHTSGLVYSYESGALNESFSDIFGVTIDYFSRPTLANWLMGDGIGGTPFRNMANPNQYSDPDTYLGTSWYSGTADNGGVHTNSGVQNYWYYLMVNGGIGKNDKNDSFWVTRLGFDTAGKIAYRNNCFYLTSTSQYADARFYAIQSALDIYGPCSQAVISTTNAWHAVGVGARFDSSVKAKFIANSTTACAAPQSIQFNNLSSNGYQYKWKFGDGDSSVLINPIHKYLNNGTYTVKLIADGGACGIDSAIYINYISVDVHNDCVAYIGDTVNNQCFGTVFDKGGPNNYYPTNDSGIFVMSPTGASSISLLFKDFDVEAGTSSGVCDYDYVQLHNGANTASASLGKFCNTNLPSLVTPYTSGANATIKMLSDPAATGRGFELKWQCTIANAKPSVRFISSTNATCDGKVKFTDQSYNSPTSWLWTFGDGGTSTVQHPSYVYNTSGIYNVRLIATNAFGSDTFTKFAFISVSRPSAPTVSNSNIKRCGSGVVSYTAAASGTIQWFDSINSTTVLATGATYSPSVSSSRSFYVQSTSINSPKTVGPIDTNIGAGAQHTATPSAYMIFDATKPCKLISVKVRANSTKNRRIQLADKYGVILKDTILMIASGTSTVNLGIDIPMGTNLRLGIHKDSSAGLYRNSAGANYPYTDTSGLISIKGHSNSATAPGYYYYFYNWVVQESNCESPRTQVTATIQSPIVLKNLDTFNCNGSTIILAPSGNNIDSIYWTSGSNSLPTKTVSPSTNSDYIYTAFNSCGSFKDTATVQALLIPTLTASNDTTICKGNSISISATSNIGVLWSSLSSTNTTQSVSPTTNTIYPIIATNLCGTARDTVKVEVDSIPTLAARSDTVICSGNSILLTANSSSTITWLPMNVQGNSVSVTPSSTSSYIAKVSSICGTKSDTVNIAVNPLPNLKRSKDTTICLGQSISLKATSNVGVTWTTLGLTDTVISVSPTSTRFYPVKSVNSCGTILDSIKVTVVSFPTLSVNNDTTICIGGSVNLKANSNITVTWQPMNITGNSIFASPTINSQYIAIASNFCGSKQDTVNVTLISTPKLIKTSNSSVCIGQSIQLNAKKTGSLRWVHNNSSDSTVTVSPSFSTLYYLESTTVCGTQRDSVFITVIPMPTLIKSKDTIICVGDSTSLSVSSNTAIYWSDLLSASWNVVVKPNKSQFYYVQATNTCGIVNDSILVALSTGPTLSASNDTVICLGKSAILKAISPSPVIWTNPISTGSTVTVTPTVASLYYLKSTDKCGTSYDTILVGIAPNPKAIGNRSVNGKKVTFTNTSQNATSYKWFFGDGTSSSVKTPPVKTYANNGTYSILLIATNSCGSDTLRMTAVINVSGIDNSIDMNSISVYPNPAKDILNIDMREVTKNENYNLEVYDVLGQKLISTTVMSSQIQTIPLNQLSDGIYDLRIWNHSQEWRRKIHVEK